MTENGYVQLHEITKENIMWIIDKITTSSLEDDFEVDEFIEDNIKNKAHAIIYENLSEKLNELINNRKMFQDEASQIFEKEIAEYSK